MCPLLCGLSLAIPGGLTAGPWHFGPGLVAAFRGSGYGALAAGGENSNYGDLKNVNGGA